MNKNQGYSIQMSMQRKTELSQGLELLQITLSLFMGISEFQVFTWCIGFVTFYYGYLNCSIYSLLKIVWNLCLYTINNTSYKYVDN